MSLYYFTNYLLVLAMLVSLYVPNGPEVVVTTGTVIVGTTAAGTAAFGNILLT